MKRFDTINVLPFIDIMLVLLAIVLTTATFIAQGDLPIQLPTANHATPANDQPALRLTITASGALLLNDETIPLPALAQKITTLPPSTRIVLQVDKATPFGDFVAVIDLLKAQSLDQLSIRTLSGS
ncbi:ExbD/TolR family protein [Halothiobacillus sp. DCM-1]|uniref:ExbD/TolR family protein n=1 Tax=Halothiobacillus sp. DCM-1 TaxID=3112558 RepID=UPI0032434DC1